MAYQIYRIGEWERVSGVDGFSTIRAYLEPGLHETEAYARKKAARLADQDYESGGDGGFQIVAVGESPFDERRPSLSAWWAAHRLNRTNSSEQHASRRRSGESRLVARQIAAQPGSTARENASFVDRIDLA